MATSSAIRFTSVRPIPNAGCTVQSKFAMREQIKDEAQKVGRNAVAVILNLNNGCFSTSHPNPNFPSGRRIFHGVAKEIRNHWDKRSASPLTHTDSQSVSTECRAICPEFRKVPTHFKNQFGQVRQSTGDRAKKLSSFAL
jgi:hypothetical protein